MLDSVAALLTYQAGICFATGQAPPRLGNRHPTIVPYETFAAADGDIVVAVGNDALFRRFCEALETPALAADPRFATNSDRLEHQETLRPLIADRLGTRPRQHWIDALKQKGVPCGAVRDLAQVLSDPQLAARRSSP
jgi:formyl-CoA transferase